MNTPGLSTVAIVLVLLGILLVPTSASPGDEIGDSGLVLAPTNGANGVYAQLDSNGEIEIRLDGQRLGVAGAGVNPNARSNFESVFTMSNQGNESLAVWTDHSASEVEFQLDSPRRSIEGPDACVLLDPGDRQTVGILVTAGSESGTILQSVSIRARTASPGDCSGTTPTPTTPTPTTPTPATPSTPGTPTPTTPTPTTPTQTATPGSGGPGGGGAGGGGGGGGSGDGGGGDGGQPDPDQGAGEPTTPEPDAPAAAIDVFPGSDLVCGAVRFDASRSSDPDGDVVSYEWTFPETTATGASVRHTFQQSGPATVELTVTDSGGRQTTTRRNLTVNDRPSVQVIVPAETDAGQPVRLEANVTDRYGDIRGVYWRFQYGSTKAGESVTHTFPEGSRSVEVRAVDSCGAQGRTTVDVDTSPRGPAETAVDAVSSGIPFVVRSAAVALLAPILFAIDRRRKGRRGRRRRR